MATWFDFFMDVVFLGSALITLVVVLAIAHEMSTGIFKRFFLFLKLAIIVIVIDRADVLTPNYGLTAVFGMQTADFAYRIVWSFLLMIAFIALYQDWKSTSLDQPIKPRSAIKI